MSREVLLLEPNYRNKYPPMGLMKISTYYKSRGDNVCFYKGDLQQFAANLLCEELVRLLFGICPDMKWRRLIPTLFQYIRYGKTADIPKDEIHKNDLTRDDADMLIDQIREYRAKFKSKDYFVNPRFDVVCVTTLFTFEWAITIDTIKFARQLCKDANKVFVGGIASSILPKEIEEETGVAPIVGILNDPCVLDADSDVIIDSLPLDYSILDEIDYKYPATDAYFAYMTRGCPNKCKYCSVPKLEPKYQNHIQLQQHLKIAQERFGEQKNLVLLDNNVLASDCYEKIIDEIVACGFGKGATYIPPNPYEIAYKNLVAGINDRAYIRLIVSLYDRLLSRCDDSKICKDVSIRDELYKKIMDTECDQIHTATKEAMLELHEFVEPLYKKYAYRPIARQKIVDFNQGVDGRLITPKNIQKLAELNIRPLRIAFDSWKTRRFFENAVRSAAAAGLTDLSNYMLYNFDEEPVDLYRRMKLSVDLCDELHVTIYSFPMKYHPNDNPKWFRNRDFIGKKWNKKYIRAVQAVLTSTRGKIGRGKQFFEAAFGADESEFHEIMMMPEALIIRRFEHDQAKRERYGKVASYANACDALTDEWREMFNALTEEQQALAIPIIHSNYFSNADIAVDNMAVHEVLRFYQIPRPDH
ncbi:MAG: cobalamin B12-binding domain-containing protein [Betaproteobacteria bacterium]|nr:cobalamin B12-binding domain-containing protein [Betaproteobacteria bacterium]